MTENANTLTEKIQRGILYGFATWGFAAAFVMSTAPATFADILTDAAPRSLLLIPLFYIGVSAAIFVGVQIALERWGQPSNPELTEWDG